jgi:NTE family protein
MSAQRKKVGLALGSGAARGFSHVGVIRVLEQAGIPVDYVAGTSIGAIVGAVYAAGALEHGEEFIETLDWKKMTLLLDPLFPVSGLLGGKRLEKLFDSLLQGKRLEEFALPFAAVAADVATGEEVVLTSGDAVKAVRASMALPGIFTPVYWEDRFLVDGGIVTPVPVQAVQNLGADVVIAVNLVADMSSRSYISTVKDTGKRLQAIEATPMTENTFWENLFPPKQPDADASAKVPEFLKETVEKSKSFVEERTQTLEQWIDERVERGRSVLRERGALISEWFTKDKDTADFPDIFSILLNSINIMQCEIARSCLQRHPADIVLDPKLGHVRLYDFDTVQECLQEGERVARDALPQIKQALRTAE